MPSGDYINVGGGALKLKGAKIQKKKKRKADKTGLEKSLVAGGKASVKQDGSATDKDSENGDGSHGVGQFATSKTESERRYEEVKRMRLEKLAESSALPPELLRTHKERVESLNTYLSKLSEHHDMPKIGPG